MTVNHICKCGKVKSFYQVKDDKNPKKLNDYWICWPCWDAQNKGEP